MDNDNDNDSLPSSADEIGRDYEYDDVEEIATEFVINIASVRDHIASDLNDTNMYLIDKTSDYLQIAKDVLLNQPDLNNIFNNIKGKSFQKIEKVILRIEEGQKLGISNDKLFDSYIELEDLNSLKAEHLVELYPVLQDKLDGHEWNSNERKDDNTPALGDATFDFFNSFNTYIETAQNKDEATLEVFDEIAGKTHEEIESLRKRADDIMNDQEKSPQDTLQELRIQRQRGLKRASENDLKQGNSKLHRNNEGRIT